MRTLPAQIRCAVLDAYGVAPLVRIPLMIWTNIRVSLCYFVSSSVGWEILIWTVPPFRGSCQVFLIRQWINSESEQVRRPGVERVNKKRICISHWAGWNPFLKPVIINGVWEVTGTTGRGETGNVIHRTRPYWIGETCRILFKLLPCLKWKTIYVLLFVCCYTDYVKK